MDCGIKIKKNNGDYKYINILTCFIKIKELNGDDRY